MFTLHRRRSVESRIRFCDGCGQVTTEAQRAERLRERTRTQAWSWLLPR